MSVDEIHASKMDQIRDLRGQAPGAEDMRRVGVPAHQIREGESVYTLLKTKYETLPLDEKARTRVPELAKQRRFPEHLTPEQARWLIGLFLRYNPELADNPHLLQVGATVVVPPRVEIAQALAAGAGSEEARELRIQELTEQLRGTISLIPVFGAPLANAIVNADVTAKLREPPHNFKKYQGSLTNPTPELKKP